MKLYTTLTIVCFASVISCLIPSESNEPVDEHLNEKSLMVNPILGREEDKCTPLHAQCGRSNDPNCCGWDRCTCDRYRPQKNGVNIWDCYCREFTWFKIWKGIMSG
uniref:U21-Hypotoxin-Hsp1a_1 n=1 Tax=Hypochilus sp. SGP-2016 TaxID=1905178 RepID=A0A482ZI65_9ARAC